MQALVEVVPEIQTAYTYFSPSAESLGERFGADVSGYLPWDHGALVGSALDALRPSVIAFTKTEVWPVMVEEARARGIPVVLVAATVPPGAGRLKWPARALMAGTWRALSAGLACSEADADGLVELGMSRERIDVTGDPGIDSAAERARAADAGASHLAPLLADPRPTVVAGSTWPADEDVLIPALTALRERVPGLRVVLAPHEPSEDRVGALLGTFLENGWYPSTLAHVEKKGAVGDVSAIVVERLGVLAHLYTAGTVAFVGGGFHDAGLHSVLEPAAAGVPVVFGPRHANARAASDLLASGGATVVTGASRAAHVLLEWLTDREKREYAGGRGRAYIEEHRGAAQRTARALASLMSFPEHR